MEGWKGGRGKDGRMGGRMGGRMEGGKDGRMERWKDGWKGGRMEGGKDITIVRTRFLEEIWTINFPTVQDPIISFQVRLIQLFRLSHALFLHVRPQNQPFYFANR